LENMYNNRMGGRGSRPTSAFKKRRNGKFTGAGPRSRGGRSFAKVLDVNLFINKGKAPLEPEKKYQPQNLFSDFAFNHQLKKTIAARGYKQPTPIQDQAIPAVLAGHDVVGLANTGTGKTAAFLLPLINKIILNPQEKVLIMTPTRELAVQIQEEFLSFAKSLRIFAVVVIGGASMGRQISELRRQHNLVIGTPGRIKDLLSRRSLNLSQFNNIVLDEADRMLDMGFIGDIKNILAQAGKKKQTLLFSATFPREIEGLIKDFLIDPKRIAIKTKEISSQIDQDIVRIKSGQEKSDVLGNLLKQKHFNKVLVFTRTKHGADKLCKKLVQTGFKAEAIHGNKSQSKRQIALRKFKNNLTDILVATDVAARGLDIPNVSHVINFDVPATHEDYIHRIGRTGRIDQKGTALTFIV